MTLAETISLLRCVLRWRHNPQRHPMGYFRCIDCGTTGDNLEDMGFDPGSGYVAPARRTFSRTPNQSFTRTSHW